MSFDLISFIVGLVIGLLVMGLLFKSTKGKAITLENMEQVYVQRSIYDATTTALQDKNKEVADLNYKLAQNEEKARVLEERLTEHKSEMEEINKKMNLEFQALSQKIFDEKSAKFIELNEKKVFDLLNPLKERLQDFEKKVDDTYKEETRERISLKKEIEFIAKLNQQVSEDTNKLTKALKGDSKKQGDWGEVQLEMILNKAGLEKDIHYIKQGNYRDEGGNSLRPDYVIKLPDDKYLVLDSKVSLVAYEQYFNTEDESESAGFLKQHVNSIAKHVMDLGGKNYQSLYGINAPDYVLMFIPIEPALYAALKEEGRLFEKALEKNVVLVSTSTLLATLRTINYIWNQDNVRKNVDEIARESGALYDKFVGFVEDLTKVGDRLDGAKKEYDNAFNKLTLSQKKGDTIVGRIERIKKLGAKNTKNLPSNILDSLTD
jgi:DNA recombination protein RmuC